MPSKIEARQSEIHGNGVFATAPLKKGERVIRYKGLLRKHDEVDRIYAEEEETGHTFLFTLNDKYVIDANVDGNDARWINHSCDPNCEAAHLAHDGGKKRKDRIYIEAMRDIAAGEELTYNYGIVLGEPHTAELKKLWACLCGSPKCTGTMLQPKKRKAKKKAKKKAKPKSAAKPDAKVKSAAKPDAKAKPKSGAKPKSKPKTKPAAKA
jgi:SET domain-containing protein